MTVSAARNMMPAALAPFAADWGDRTVEDLFVNGPGRYFVRRGTTTTVTEAPGLDALAIEAFAAYASHVRKQYADEESPLLDCELPSGERVSIVLPPCTPEGFPALSIRRASERIASLDELEGQGLWKRFGEDGAEFDWHRLDEQRKYMATLRAGGEITRLLRYCVHQRLSVGFVGETGSGKTHDVTALVMEIPHHERLVTVADAEEWGRLPHPNRVSLLSTKGGSIGMERLIEAALRMAPRWLLVQEVRDGAAFALLRALASGAPGIFTWHAKSAEKAFDALSVMIRQHDAGARLPEETLRQMLRDFVDVVVHVTRQADGNFRATEIKFGHEL